MILKRIVLISSILYLLISGNMLFAGDYKTILNLSGYWRFNIGDNNEWAKSSYNDKDWDKIMVPGAWENNGYVGYDGFAWLRKSFEFPEYSAGQMIFLCINNIDDVDEIFLNGNQIGRTGCFPPDYVTAYDWNRRYIIPEKFIIKNGTNLLAVRVYDGGGEGGIVNGPVNLCIDEDEDYLSLNLAGEWKFHLHDNKEWSAAGHDDSKWKTINVPMFWESQGYDGFDGYAWYRKTFDLPAGLKDKDLVLVLGKIDDEDKVYLNGELIGTVFQLKEHTYYKWSEGNEYRILRGYDIPSDVIKTGRNVIAVRVYDKGLAGGIYEGPIGIMTDRNFRIYKDSHESEDEPWNSIFDFLWR